MQYDAYSTGISFGMGRLTPTLGRQEGRTGGGSSSGLHQGGVF